MLQIYCPFCEENREEEEFAYAGEACIVRPPAPEALSDRDWGDYLYFRSNPCGRHRELWYHSAGCRRYLCAVRDTVSSEIVQTCAPGALPDSAAASTEAGAATPAEFPARGEPR